MTFRITEECTNCNACVALCPNDAIEKGIDMPVLIPEKCTHCEGFFDEPQCVDICPVDCIVEYPES